MKEQTESSAGNPKLDRGIGIAVGLVFFGLAVVHLLEIVHLRMATKLLLVSGIICAAVWVGVTAVSLGELLRKQSDYPLWSRAFTAACMIAVCTVCIAGFFMPKFRTIAHWENMFLGFIFCAISIFEKTKPVAAEVQAEAT